MDHFCPKTWGPGEGLYLGDGLHALPAGDLGFHPSIPGVGGEVLEWKLMWKT